MFVHQKNRDKTYSEFDNNINKHFHEYRGTDEIMMMIKTVQNSQLIKCLLLQTSLTDT